MPDVPDFNVTGYLKRDHYHKDSVDVTVYIVSIIDKHSSYMGGVLVLPSEMIETVVKTTASDKYAIEIVSAAGTSFFAGDEDLWCKFNNGTTLRTELIKNDQIYGEAKAALVNGTNATEVTDAQKITIRAGERGIWYIKNQVCHSNASEVYLVKLIVE
jgi:hypothetical protein